MGETLVDWSAGLHDLIAAYPEGLSEYELLSRLDEDPENSFEKGNLRDSLNLFQTHFLLFHALYRLQEMLVKRQEGYLEITALCIRLRPLQSENGNGLAGVDPLRDYYLDLANLEQTRESDVEDMLGLFWQRYLLQDQRDEYLAVLGLEAGATHGEIREQYRRLAMQHHPDRGGEGETLQAINAAYAALMGK